jgi:predicted transcriptional regulator
MDVNMTISKKYANEVVSDYEEIVEKVDVIIKQTGYKGKFIAKKLGLPESTFYQKKRKKAFNQMEMKQLISLMDDEEDDDDDVAVEFAYFEKTIKERENEPTIPLQEFIANFKAKRQKT